MKSTDLDKVISVVSGKVWDHIFDDTICIVTNMMEGKYIDVAYPLEKNDDEVMCATAYTSCRPGGFDITIRPATKNEITRWKYAKGVGSSYRRKVKSTEDVNSIPWIGHIITGC